MPNEVLNEKGNCEPTAALLQSLEWAKENCPNGYGYGALSTEAYCVDLTLPDQHFTASRVPDDRTLLIWDRDGLSETWLRVPDGIQLEVLFDPLFFSCVPPYCSIRPPITKLSKDDEYVIVDRYGTVQDNEAYRSSYDPDRGTFNFLPALGGSQ